MDQNVVKPFFPGGLTVLMSVYHGDNPQLFELSVQSIFKNSILPDDMILVIDGVISPEIEDVVKKVTKSNLIQVVRLPKNLGLAYALNEGIKHIKTTWFARADADDINRSDRFEKQLGYILNSKNDVDIIGSCIDEFDQNNNFQASRIVPEFHNEIVKYLKTRNPFNHMTVILRTSCVKDVGGYPLIYLREDYALWVKLISNGAKCYNVQESLVNATTGLEMYKRRGGVKYVMAEFNLQRLMVNMRIKSLRLAIVHSILRGTVFLLPSRLRGKLYLKFFKKDKKIK